MKWIDIKKKKPTHMEEVLITDGNTVTAAETNAKCKYTNNGIDWNSCGFGGYEWEWDFDIESITHWASLPYPPKQEER